MLRRRSVFAVVLMLGVAAIAVAQSEVSSQGEKGFVSFAEFGGSVSSGAHVLRLNTSAGYNITQHFGVDFGVPFYFVGGSSTTSTGTNSTFSGTGLGAPYFDVRWMAKNPTLSYAGSLTDTLPYGDTNNGLSTGRWTFDWNNHFEHSFGRLTPFGEIGIANIVSDSTRYRRPYISFGYNAHMEGGAGFDLTDNISVGGSVYDIAPWGTQTLYSRIVPKNSNAMRGNGNAKQIYTQNAITGGSADLTRDDGFSAYADFTPAPYATIDVGFTRSQTFALNTVSFGLRFNIGYLAKRSAHSHN